MKLPITKKIFNAVKKGKLHLFHKHLETWKAERIISITTGEYKVAPRTALIFSVEQFEETKNPLYKKMGLELIKNGVTRHDSKLKKFSPEELTTYTNWLRSVKLDNI